MLRSLVGSEMCIRDSDGGQRRDESLLRDSTIEAQRTDSKMCERPNAGGPDAEATDGSKVANEERSGDLRETKVDGRAGVRPDQSVPRFPSIFTTKFEEDAG